MNTYAPYLIIAIVLIIVFGFRFLLDSAKRLIAIGLVIAGLIWVSQTYDVDPNAIWSYTYSMFCNFINRF